jgi:3',5'-cyclic AMP phosphodiesterase CpdA
MQPGEERPVNGFTLAHLSDLHLPLDERTPRLRDLLSKRLFSYLSWKRSRRRIHRPEVLARLMEDVRAAAPDHTAVTGDLVNLALPEEFVRARRWLLAQGGVETLTVVPGNHDALVPVPWAEGLGRWSEWMGEGVSPPEAFPFVRRMGEAALIGLSTAVPTAPFLASGRLGDMQLMRLARTLALLGQEGVFRVVMLHHPLVDGQVAPRKALEDRAALRQVLHEYGAELVLHGHSHHATVESVPGPAGPIPVVGAPSASAAPGESAEDAGWRLIGVEPGNDAWTVTVATRAITPSGGFETRDARTIRVARAQPSPLSPAF